MLHWFPTPYPDELLYSVFARYHICSGNISPKMTIEELFGKRTVRSVWDLPANIDALLRQLGPYWNAEELIKNHTMYPYYAPFLFPEQAKEVKKSMLDSKKVSTIHTRTGVTASNVKIKSNFWVCNDCISEDIDTYGETYWRRVHQAPGVFICPNHKSILEETNISTKAQNQHEFIVAIPQVKRTKPDLKGINNKEFQLLSEIATATETLLNNLYLQNTDNTIRLKYMELLKRNDYASMNNMVKRDRLYKNFQEKFTDSSLVLLQSLVNYKESDWLTMIFQKHRKSFHPLRHILIMIFLEIDLDQLFGVKQYLPFGNGPWLCLNSVCSNYKKPVITNLTITVCYDTRKTVGTFHCDCGFIFSRRGPDQSKEDLYRIGTIKEYGDTWKRKLTQLVNDGISLTEIAKKMNADRATIKKYAAELELNVTWKQPKLIKKNNRPLADFKTQLDQRKNKWLTLQVENPEKLKTELRKMVPDVFAFLYKNDRNWLNNNSPVNKRKQPLNQRVDWEKRDNELLESVREFVQNWDIDVERPTRISVTSIGRKLNDISLLQKKADKLPNTMNFIYKISENTVSYQKRRVEFWIERLKKEGEPLREWKVYEKAGLRSNVSNEVKRLISKRISEYDPLEYRI